MAADRGDRLSFDDAEILRLSSPALAGHTMKLVALAPGAPDRVASARWR